MQGQPSSPLGLHTSHWSEVLHDDYVISWKSLTGDLNTKLLLIAHSDVTVCRSQARGRLLWLDWISALCHTV